MHSRHQKEGRERRPEAQRSAFLALEGARAARSDIEGSEQAVRAALAIAPDDLDVRIAAYKFYFYNHRLAEALPHAELILVHAARRLNIAGDWREVAPEDAAFGEALAEPGLYLQALIAWGYCKVRLGQAEEGRLALLKASALDPKDRFGAKRLLAVLAAREAEQDGEA